jgi:2-dehydropantoate 2-reductase
MSCSQKQVWFILGAGAIGSLWAHWLKDRAQVIVKDNNNRQSVRKLLIEKTFVEPNTQEHSTISCVSANNIKTALSYLLICTKAQQTLSAVSALNIHPQATIVLLQNGLGVYDNLKKKFPEANIFSASTTHGAWRKTPTHIVHAGQGSTWLGSLDTAISKQQIDLCAQDLSNDQETIISDLHIEKRLWKKLAINCAINPLTLIYECKNGELLRNSQYHMELKNLCKELDLVLRAKKILAADESILQTVEEVADQTANNFSSMLQDRQHKRSSEIEYIQGYLCQQALALAIPVPENQKLLTTIRKIEAQY